jgi:hypothetical protein
MSKLTDRLTPKRQAFGTTFASTPAFKDTQARVREWFASGVDEDEIRRRLRLQMVQDDDIGLRLVLGLNRKALRLPADKALVVLAKHYADKIGSKRLEDLLARWAQSAGLLDWLADYHIAWYKTGTPPAMSGSFFGGVVTVPIGPKDDRTPLVMAIAGPVSDPEALAEQFLDECYRAFPAAFARKEHSERDAERHRLFADGLSDFKIARKELEDGGLQRRAVGTTEYNRRVKVRANAVLHARKRWLEYVTNIGELVPPNTD